MRHVEIPVVHRPRTAGETKYGMGITKRAIPGLIDLFAVRYMRNRRRPVANAEIVPVGAPSVEGPAHGAGGAGSCGCAHVRGTVSGEPVVRKAAPEAAGVQS